MVIFLAVFGLIVLAEVLFIDGGENPIYYEDLQEEADEEERVEEWETPRPLDPAAGALGAKGADVARLASSGLRWVLGRSPSPSSYSSSFSSSSRGRPRNERFQKSLELHRGEMESLIKNISTSSSSSSSSKKEGEKKGQKQQGGRRMTTSGPARPYNYSSELKNKQD